MTFHRTNFWVFGRKMAKADLTYLIQPNHRVLLECSEISPQVDIHPSIKSNHSFILLSFSYSFIFSLKTIFKLVITGCFVSVKRYLHRKIFIQSFSHSVILPPLLIFLCFHSCIYQVIFVKSYIS